MTNSKNSINLGSKNQINRDFIASEIKRLGPFLHNVELPFGLHTVSPETAQPLEETRLSDLKECLIDPLKQKLGSFAGLDVMEVACNCGGVSFEVAKQDARTVLGTDVAAHYIEQANFIKKTLGIDNVSFSKHSIDESPDLGSFDITICCGLLYHLENPVGSLRALARATKQYLALDTQVIAGESEPVWKMSIVPAVTREKTHKVASRGLWRTQEACQFKPSVAAVVQLLKFVGFNEVEVLPVDMNHRTKTRSTGALRTFIASK